MTVDHRALFERYVAALNRRDSEHLDELFTEDVVIEYPQSGEVIRGRHNLRALIEHNPAGPPGADPSTARAQGIDELRIVAPMFTVVLVQGGGLTGSSTVRVLYPDGSTWWMIHMYELREVASRARRTSSRKSSTLRSGVGRGSSQLEPPPLPTIRS